MTHRVLLTRRLVAVLAVGAAVLTGCGTGTQAPTASSLGSNDINPQPREKLRDGGDLRMPLSQVPTNFNYNEVDGTSGDMGTIDDAVLPRMFNATANGGTALNTDYLTSAEITSTTPQVITYTINPKAVWSDGTPITWRDFQAYWQALNGKNPAFQVAGTNGYADMVSVTRGTDDKQAVVTFDKPYGEWKTLFTPLTPASLNSDPNTFNTAWQTGMPLTSGPFVLQSVDQTSKTITLSRNPKWWGTPPKLNRIIMRYYDTKAMADGLANNELDLMGIGGEIDLLRRAQRIPDATIRNAPGRFAFNLTLNGGAGSPLADLRVRQAVAQSIDRQQIAERQLGQSVPGVKADGNHFFAPGEKEYQDNSSALPFDPPHAQQALDQLGWVRPAPTAPRTKGGKPLTVRLVYATDPSNTEMAKTVQNQLAAVGVTVQLEEVNPNQFFPVYVNRGNFDVALLGWVSSPSPLGDAAGIYQQPLGNNVQQNYGRIGTPEINALIAQGLTELDDTKRAAIANQVDRLVWQEAHSLILFAVPGMRAVRSTLANLGSPGFADPDFINAGFVK
jgi:peptide/nickel transport system substrate-binding protein